MSTKTALKRILAKIYKKWVKHHRTSPCDMTVQEAKAILADLYEAPRYECNGVLQDENEYDFSIIVPVYNGEKYLRRCIESLINQKTSYKYEIIFVNDGSKDSSADILSEYEKNDFIRAVSQENGGISCARNKGISMAKGRYIGFVDNDDYVSDNYVDLLISAAKKSDADVVKCGCIEFDSETDEILHDFGNHKDASYENGLGKSLFKYDGFIWGGCYKKEFWGKIQFPLGYWYEDMITRFLLFRRAKSFEYIGESLYFKREHATNSAKKIWVSGNVKALDQYYLVKELIRLSEEYGLEEDAILFRLIVSEFGFMLGHRTYDLEDEYRKAVFVLAADLVDKYPKEYDFDDVFCRSLRNKDFKLWKMATRYRKLKY